MVVTWVRYGYNHGENIEHAGADALVGPLTDVAETGYDAATIR